MDEARLSLVRVSAALSPCSTVDLRAALREAAQVADAAQIEEVLLQAYLFAGYPASLNGFRLWREMGGAPVPPPTHDEPALWPERGQDVCRRVYAGQYERLRANVAALHPDMERWMLNEGYGKVLGRPGLDLATRELCIAALLASMDVQPQLYAHLRGAVNAGASEQDVEASLREAGRGMSSERSRAAREVWARVRERRRRKNGS